MENIDEIPIEDNGTDQFLPNLNLPTETSDKEDRPQKRIKLDDQNLYWVDTTRNAPEDFNLESLENLASDKQEYSCTPSSAPYSSEMKTASPRQNYTESAFQDHQGSVGSISLSAWEAPIRGVGMASSNEINLIRRYKRHMKKLQLANKQLALTHINELLTPKAYSCCTLCPPRNGIIPKPKLERPPGCKSVVIAGLPESLPGKLARKMFSNCGKIRRIIKIKKEVFQVTYARCISVDNAIHLNGYKVVGTLKNRSFTSSIEVDFAHIWEEEQQYFRQMGIKTKPISTRLSDSSSDNLYSHYSRMTALKLIQGLKEDSMVEHSVNVLVRWLEAGQCTKKNFLQIFKALEAMHGLVFRFISDPMKFEEFVRQNYCSQILKVFVAASSETVLSNCNQSKLRNLVEIWKKFIEEICQCNSFDAASAFIKKKTDPESSAQHERIKNNSSSEILYSNYSRRVAAKLIERLEQDSMIEHSLNVICLWIEKGQCKNYNYIGYFLALKAMYGLVSRFIRDPTKFEEFVHQNYCSQILKVFDAGSDAVLNNLLQSNLRKQVKMWKSYIEEVNKFNSWDAISAFVKRKKEQKMVYLKKSPMEMERPNKELKASEESLEINISKKRKRSDEVMSENYQTKQNANDSLNNTTIGNQNIENDNPNNNNILNNESDNQNNEKDIQIINKNDNENNNQNDIGVKIVGKEAYLIATLGAFLNLHRFGASIEDICKYLLKIDPTTTSQCIEGLMRKFPTVFREELTNCDDGSKTKWTILGF